MTPHDAYKIEQNWSNFEQTKTNATVFMNEPTYVNSKIKMENDYVPTM